MNSVRLLAVPTHVRIQSAGKSLKASALWVVIGARSIEFRIWMRSFAAGTEGSAGARYYDSTHFRSSVLDAATADLGLGVPFSLGFGLL
jgi:hypothetical protein